MYPSSNSSNYSPNISSSNLFHIPSPSMQYEHELFQYFHEHFLQPQQQLLTPETTTTINKDTTVISSTNDVEEEEELIEGGASEGCKNKKGDMSSTTNASVHGKIPARNKRVSKKDRHSKINTAHGPRDRRMRLSLDVARKFFNLQDLLGFDKASKTVEWLLTKSKSSIKELSKGLPHMNKESCSTTIGAISTSSTSECEVISGIDQESASNNQKNQPNVIEVAPKEIKKKSKPARRAAFNPVAKESRKQARARARERTKIKKSCVGDPKLCYEAISDDLKRLGAWTPFEAPEKQAQVEELASHHEKQLMWAKENIVDDSNFVVTSNWSPYTIFNYHHINAGTGIPHEHQFSDFQFNGKLWEA